MPETANLNLDRPFTPAAEILPEDNSLPNKVGISPEQEKTVAKTRVKEFEENYQITNNFERTVESFRETPGNPKEKAQYTIFFNQTKLFFLANLQVGMLNVAMNNHGINEKDFFTEIKKILDSNLEGIKTIASKSGNPTSIGLSELQPPTETEINNSRLSEPEKTALKSTMLGGKLYKFLKGDVAAMDRKKPETKKLYEAAVAQLTQEYLFSIAENIATAGYRDGSGDSMIEILQIVLMDTVGDGKLSLAEFEKIHTKIQSKYGKIFEKADSHKLGDFEKLLETAKEKNENNPEDFLIERRTEMLKATKTANIEAKGNPYNLFTRRYGDLKWVALFAGEKWIYATLGLNAILNGKNTLTNPVFMGLAAAAGGIYAYENPEILQGKSETEREKSDSLREELQGLRASDPDMANWLGLVDKKDLEKEKPLGRFLAAKKQKAEYWVSSSELEENLKKIHPNFKEILPGEDNPKGRKFYDLLVKCQESELNPSGLIENADKPETNND